MKAAARGIKDAQTEIMIVDDNPNYSYLLSKMLSGVFGYQRITVLSSVESAFEAIRAEPVRYKLLFIDYKFPSGVTGGDLLKMLALHNLLKDKVAFLVTSDPTVDNVNEALAAGAIAVVAKPFDREELRAQLEKAERALLSDGVESF